MSGETLAFRSLDSEELRQFLVFSRADYVRERMVAGETSDEANANADASMARTFPGGHPAPGQTLVRLLDGTDDLGLLWLGPLGEDPTRWWVC